MMTYYDGTVGRERIKRRYVWGFWGFCLGVTTAVAFIELLF